jgi:hypothetical protein
MTANYDLVLEEDKSFGNYIYCYQCEWNGVPNQKVVIVYLGIRPAKEPGFIQKYETFDHSEDRDKETYRHKFDAKLIEQLVRSVFDRNKGGLL